MVGKKTKHTSYAGKQLASEALNLTAWEWHKTVGLEKVENALPQQIGDDADMIPEIKAVSQVDTPVPIRPIVGSQSRQHS